MANKKFKESDLYTVLFATGMVVIVGVGLAFLATFTKPNIDANKKVEKQQNILQSIGLNPSKEEAGEMFNTYIKEQLTLNANGEEVTDVEAFSVNLKNDKENLPLYIAEKDGKTMYVIPLYGKGLWDAIWGYMALNDDLTVSGVVFDHKGETPGLGAEITQDFFENQFKGEHILNTNGEFAGIDVSKSNGDPTNEDVTDNEVDAITGATITGNGVAQMIEERVGKYMNYFKNKNQIAWQK